MYLRKFTQDNFENEVLKAEKTVIVDFFATWCGPCKMQSPIMDEIAGSRNDLIVGKIDVDENRDLAIKYGVMSIPTIMVFKNGEAKNVFIGLTSKEDILEAV